MWRKVHVIVLDHPWEIWSHDYPRDEGSQCRWHPPRDHDYCSFLCTPAPYVYIMGGMVATYACRRWTWECCVWRELARIMQSFHLLVSVGTYTDCNWTGRNVPHLLPHSYCIISSTAWDHSDKTCDRDKGWQAGQVLLTGSNHSGEGRRWCVCERECVCMYVCTCASVHARVCSYMCVYVCTRVYQW